MTEAKTSEDMSPGLMRVAERAKRNPKQKVLALAQYIDAPALARAFRRLRKDAAVGVDGVTVEQYEQNLEEKLEELFFSSRRRHTRFDCDWSSDVCSSD